MGKDTHGLSGPAQCTALEVLAGNGVETVIQQDDGFTPTPVISRAILVHNRSRGDRLADGIVVTPSHNPPEDGGFKYNPTNGGPAETDVIQWIEDRANELLQNRKPRTRSRPTLPTSHPTPTGRSSNHPYRIRNNPFWLPPFGPAIRIPQQKPPLSCRGPMVRIHLPPAASRQRN